MRFRALLLALLPVAAAAGDDTQIEWIGDWDKAFALAKESRKPVMVCINSKDGERASDATAKDIYRDPEFVALSRRFVMVIVSTLHHRDAGACTRFGGITCEEHRACYTALAAAHGERLLTAFAQGEMVTPQHVWFTPDGLLFRRKEYWMDKAELLERMKKALEDAPSVQKEEGAGEEAPPGTPPAEAPLTAADEAELTRAEGKDGDGRRAALGNLLATEKAAARRAIVELLSRTGSADVKCDVLRALGHAQVLDARLAIEEHLEHKDPLVRSFAAVALERLGQVESVEALVKRSKVEREQVARKNAVRALGACGGPAANETAAEALLKIVNGDKQMMIRKHAALSLRAYSGEKARALVGPKLEKAAPKAKDRGVRGAIVYTLAYVGNKETAEPVLQKILEETHDDNAKTFVREALRILRGEGGEFSRAAWFLFWEDREDPARNEGGQGGG
jgi:hypothetical protein